MSDISQSANVAPVAWQKDGRGQGQSSRRDLPANKITKTYVASDRVISDDVMILGVPAGQVPPEMQAAVAGLLNEVQSLRAQLGLPSRGRGDGPHILDRDSLLESAENHVARGVSDGVHLGAVLIHVTNFDELRQTYGFTAAARGIEDLADRIRQSAPLRIGPIGMLDAQMIAGLAERESEDDDWTGPQAALDVWLEGQTIDLGSAAVSPRCHSRITEIASDETFIRSIDRLDAVLCGYAERSQDGTSS